MTIVAELVGLDEAGRRKMLRWAAATFNILGVMDGRGVLAVSRTLELLNYIRTLSRANVTSRGLGYAPVRRRRYHVGHGSMFLRVRVETLPHRIATRGASSWLVEGGKENAHELLNWPRRTIDLHAHHRALPGSQNEDSQVIGIEIASDLSRPLPLANSFRER